jgi:hypothetical protein
MNFRGVRRFTFIGILAFAFIMISFNNCSMVAPPIELSSSAPSTLFFSGGCEADLMNLYSRTYYPFLTQTCRACHTNGPGIGQFGHFDFSTSYEAFTSIGREKIHNQALNAAHQPAYTGPQNLTRLSPFVSQWEAAETAFANCQGLSPNQGLVTLHKTDSLVAQRAGTTTWTPLSWNLETEMADTDKRGLYRATATIEVRVATIGGVRRGYEFRNPSLRLNVAGNGYTIKGLMLSINNKIVSDVTTYSQLEMGVNSTTNTILAPGSGFALAVMDMNSATDVFALEFGEIKDGVTAPTTGGGTPPPTAPVLPSRVTWTQLVSTDATLGVFTRYCNSCHNAANARGALNLLDYNQARAAANNIQSRMNSSSNPMPPTGPAPFESRELIRIWIQSGTPQN